MTNPWHSSQASRRHPSRVVTLVNVGIYFCRDYPRGLRQFGEPPLRRLLCRHYHTCHLCILLACGNKAWDRVEQVHHGSNQACAQLPTYRTRTKAPVKADHFRSSNNPTSTGRCALQIGDGFDSAFMTHMSKTSCVRLLDKAVRRVGHFECLRSMIYAPNDLPRYQRNSVPVESNAQAIQFDATETSVLN